MPHRYLDVRNVLHLPNDDLIYSLVDVADYMGSTGMLSMSPENTICY